jgi:predicted RNase H-like HicB family nuclease
MGLVKEVHMQVVALIDEDEGQFGVSFPDFPGCTTIGMSPDDAVTRAAEVLAFHVEGLAEDGPLPVPRTLAELHRDKSFRRDAKDALVALVPYAPPTRAVRINITLDESLLERVDRTAESLGETRSGFLAAAARKRLADATS